MLERIVAPEGAVVTVDRAKQRLRIDGTDSDDDLEALIEAATGAVEHETGLTLRPTTFELRADNWLCSPVNLPAAPFRDVVEVAYLDTSDAEQEVDAANYYVDRTSEGAHLHFVAGFSSPSLSDRKGAVRYRFSVGFDDPGESGSGDDPTLVLPATAVMAVLFLVGHWYENRESVLLEQRYEVPDTFRLLSRQLRVFR
jgi:uncharacterized phiE125 gp8 family phage protein